MAHVPETSFGQGAAPYITAGRVAHVDGLGGLDLGRHIVYSSVVLHLVGLLGAVVPARCGAAGRSTPAQNGLPRARAERLGTAPAWECPARCPDPRETKLSSSRLARPDALSTAC